MLYQLISKLPCLRSPTRKITTYLQIEPGSLGPLLGSGLRTHAFVFLTAMRAYPSHMWVEGSRTPGESNARFETLVQISNKMTMLVGGYWM